MTQETERDCHVCEDGTYQEGDAELICDTCYHVPTGRSSRQSEQTDSWEWFWQKREDYSGFYGPERVKMVGGFAGAY